MAKFKPGDKVTWQHHNGSYSNEVIDYIVPPNGYAFKDGGVGAESELRAGWVTESQTGRANMPHINSRARNGVRSRNAVVAKALNACGTARNAWGDETQVNGLITKMLGLINKIKPIAQQLYDTAFDLDDAGSVWLGQNKGSKDAQKVKIAVERANKVMKRLANFTSGLD